MATNSIPQTPTETERHWSETLALARADQAYDQALAYATRAWHEEALQGVYLSWPNLWAAYADAFNVPAGSPVPLLNDLDDEAEWATTTTRGLVPAL